MADVSDVDPRIVECEACSAEVDKPCRSRSARRTAPHAVRRRAAEHKAAHGPFRDGRVHVLAEKCHDCVFWPGNRMRLHEGRLKDLVQENVQADSALTCHNTLDEWPGSAPPAVCRGFFDAYETTPLLWAKRLGMIDFNPAP